MYLNVNVYPIKYIFFSHRTTKTPTTRANADLYRLSQSTPRNYPTTSNIPTAASIPVASTQNPHTLPSSTILPPTHHPLSTTPTTQTIAPSCQIINHNSVAAAHIKGETASTSMGTRRSIIHSNLNKTGLPSCRVCSWVNYWTRISFVPRLLILWTCKVVVDRPNHSLWRLRDMGVTLGQRRFMAMIRPWDCSTNHCIRRRYVFEMIFVMFI